MHRSKRRALLRGNARAIFHALVDALLSVGPTWSHTPKSIYSAFKAINAPFKRTPCSNERPTDRPSENNERHGAHLKKYGMRVYLGYTVQTNSGYSTGNE